MSLQKEKQKQEEDGRGVALGATCGTIMRDGHSFNGGKAVNQIIPDMHDYLIVI